MGQVIKKIDFYPNRLEENMDGRIHIHFGDVRLDLSKDEFLIFRQYCLEGYQKLKERHISWFDKK